MVLLYVYVCINCKKARLMFQCNRNVSKSLPRKKSELFVSLSTANDDSPTLAGKRNISHAIWLEIICRAGNRKERQRGQHNCPFLKHTHHSRCETSAERSIINSMCTIEKPRSQLNSPHIAKLIENSFTSSPNQSKPMIYSSSKEEKNEK
jgi:hypothetical protein